MPAFQPNRFVSPAVLKAVSRENLCRLLEPFRAYLTEHGYTLPKSSASAELDHEKLTRALLAAGEDIPPALAEALFFIDSVALDENLDVLMDDARRIPGIKLRPDVTTADLALELWLADKSILFRRYSEQNLVTKRSYESFVSSSFPCPSIKLSDKNLRAMEDEMNEWFSKRKRGRGSRIMTCQKGSAIWFLIRHGEVFTRQGCLEGDDSTSVFFRPEKHDVVVFDQSYGEIRVNAVGVRVKELYRRVFGKHFFGSDQFFQPRAKYTLEPLRAADEAALVCSDVAGMESVTLEEVRWDWQDEYGGEDRLKNANVFAALKKRALALPDKPRLVRATFRVKFTATKVGRAVVICDGNQSQYARDADCTQVEEWLAKRGFIVKRKVTANEAGLPALDVA